LESCYTDNNTYSGSGNGGSCLSTNTGLSLGTAQGQVEVTAATSSTYTIVGHSKSGGDFTIAKDASGNVTRTCSGGSCSGGTW
jgi:hypothetical protein